MLRISAARIFITYRATVMTRPIRNTNCDGVVGNATVTSVPLPALISPPLAKPMNRMNRPMPTPMDRFSATGTAFMIASRRPIATRTVTTMPSSTITPIAPAGVRPLPIRVNATIPLMPSPAARANG